MCPLISHLFCVVTFALPKEVGHPFALDNTLSRTVGGLFPPKVYIEMLGTCSTLLATSLLLISLVKRVRLNSTGETRPLLSLEARGRGITTRPHFLKR